MKTNLKTVFDELKAMGAPVKEKGGSFLLSARHNFQDENRTFWASWWHPSTGVLGVNTKLVDIASKQGVHFEWENKGTLRAVAK